MKNNSSAILASLGMGNKGLVHTGRCQWKLEHAGTEKCDWCGRYSSNQDILLQLAGNLQHDGASLPCYGSCIHLSQSLSPTLLATVLLTP